MERVAGSGRAAVGYAAVALSAIAVYQFLPPPTLPTAYFLISLAPVVPSAVAIRRTPPGHRRSSWTLMSALAVLSVGNLATAISVARHSTDDAGAWPVTIGHVMLLVAALQVVRQRGRDNIGGIIDATAVAIGLTGTVWTVLFQPRLVATGAGFSQQASLLVIMLSLAGILGALLRLELINQQPLPALRLLMASLMFAMIGDVGQALTGNFVTLDRPVWIQISFMLAYSTLGVATAHPSMAHLPMPGPRSRDDLSLTRLVFLGAALAVNPIVAGVQQRVGGQVDATLIAIATAIIVPLVMARIGLLSAQRARAEKALSYQATHDALTGLLNRAEILTRLTVALRAGAPPPVVLFCDLNGFKEVNDRLGHAAGDDLLQDVSQRLAGCLREGDTLGRYGGDEFVVLCAQATPETAVVGLSERIRHAFSEPFEAAGESVQVGVSIGVVHATPGTSAAAVLRQADEAMYLAKRNRDQGAAISLHVA